METVQNQILDELATRKLQRERIFKYKAKGTIICLTAHWYIDGGKYTKYFLNLEHLHFNKNKKLSKAYMYSHQNDNSVVKKDNKISKKNLYFSCHTNKWSLWWQILPENSSLPFANLKLCAKKWPPICHPEKRIDYFLCHSIWLSLRWIPPLSENLDLVPTVPQSFYLTIFKLDPSLKWAPRIGSYCSSVILFDYL